MTRRPRGVFSNFDNSRSFLQGATPSAPTPPRGIGQNKLGAGASFFPSQCRPASLSPSAQAAASAGNGQASVIKLFTVNPITVPATVGGIKLMLANANRLRWSVTNVSTDIIFLGLGKIPTATSYDHVLPACVTSANDGSGGVIVDETWLGEIFAIALVGGAVAITEDP